MSAAAHRQGPRPCGFTLMEMLVVVVIIGIVIAGALLSLGNTGRDRGLTQERDRLVDLIAYTRDRGDLLTLEYGIRCGIHGYTFSVYDPRLMQWVPDPDDDALRPRKLPAGMSLKLVIEGRQIVLDDRTLNAPASAAPTAAGGAGTGLSGSSASGSGLSSNGGLGSTGNPGSTSSFGAAGSSGLSGFSGGATGSGSGTGSSSTLATTVDYTPQILLYSNGDTNSFTLTIVRDSTGSSVNVQSHDDGNITAGDVIQGRSP